MITKALSATLRSEDHEAQLVERGFVVVDIFDEDVLGQILAIADRVYVDERIGFHASNLSGAHEYRRAVNREVTPIVGQAAGALFVDHEPFFSSFVVKWVDGDTSFPSHQDWNMVDEQTYRSVNVFVPLVDIDASNGALRVLPGSHQVLRPVRCSPMPPAGCESTGWAVTHDEMDVVELRRGQALVFDHALLHSSAPNTTDRPRWAAITAFKPRNAELYHWYLPDPDRHELEVYRVDSEFFADFDIGGRPAGEPIRVEPFVWDDLSKPDLLARCGRTTNDTPPSIAAGVQTGVSMPDAAWDRSSGAMLRDEAQQAHLDEFGWVVVDLLDESELNALRSAHTLLDHKIVLGKSFADGFHATIVDDRPSYRQASHRALTDCLSGPCERRFRDLQLVMTNWVHKEPGAAAAPRHVDWSFVDELKYRSLSVWTPLVDTDIETGCIGVVDRSHEHVHFVRAAAHPGHLETDREFASWPGARLLPMRAGQAVIYDHRTIHYSQPHQGDRPRVAATAEFVPKCAELVHFEQVGTGAFRRHIVRPEFFVNYVAGQDPRTVEGHVRDEELSLPSFDQFHSISHGGAGSFVARDEGPVESPAPDSPTRAAMTTMVPAPTSQRSSTDLMRKLGLGRGGRLCRAVRRFLA